MTQYITPRYVQSMDPLPRHFHELGHGLQFSYGNARQRNFTVEKTEPLAWGKASERFMGGVLSSIHHLVYGIFFNLRAIFGGNSTALKAVVFYSIREFEGGVGALVSLFDQHLGQFLIEEAHFHQEAYRYFAYPFIPEAQRATFVDTLIRDGILIRFAQQSKLITLDDLKKMAPQEFKESVQRFELQGVISEEKLAKMNRHALENISLYDLKFSKGVLNYTQLTDEEFDRLTMGEVAKGDEHSSAYLKARIEERAPHSSKRSFLLYEDQLPIIAIPFLSPSDIAGFLPAFSANLISLLTDEQIRLAIPHFIGGTLKEEHFNPLFGEGRSDRLSILTPYALDRMLPIIPAKYLKFLTPQQREGLDVARLTDKQINDLFPPISIRTPLRSGKMSSAGSGQTVVVDTSQDREQQEEAYYKQTFTESFALFGKFQRLQIMERLDGIFSRTWRTKDDRIV